MVPQQMLDGVGKPAPYTISYPDKDAMGNFLSHGSASSVFGIHNVGWMFVQATVAILILVGFESVTAIRVETKNLKSLAVPIASTISWSLIFGEPLRRLFSHRAVHGSLPIATRTHSSQDKCLRPRI